VYHLILIFILTFFAKKICILYICISINNKKKEKKNKKYSLKICLNNKYTINLRRIPKADVA